MNLEEVLILKHVSDSGGDGHLLPCLESLLSILDCRVEFLMSGLRDLANEFLGGLYAQIKKRDDLQG